MEGCCLDRFIKQGNVSSFYDNGGGDVHQSNDKIGEFRLHLSDSKLQNAATTTAHLHHVAEVRHKSFEPTPGDISTRSDYAERFGFDPDGQIQN